MVGLPNVFRKQEEPAVEALDLEALKSRIGEPLPPKEPAPEPEATVYRRSDGPPAEERSWRRIAGLTR